MTAVTNWTEGLLTGLSAGMSRLFGAIPNIIGAILVLVIGWIIAGILGSLVTKLCRVIHVDTVADRVGVNDFLRKSGARILASNVIGEIVKWVVRLVFIEMAAEQLGMPQVTSVINQMLAFIPNIVVAMVILGAGAFFGQILGGIVRGAAIEAGVRNPNLLARLTYGAVIAFAVIAALNELNVAPIVVNTLYIGLVAAIALALGLSFGLGGRESAARLTERWISRIENVSTKVHGSADAPTSTVITGTTAPRSASTTR